jgi:hypothetical protein
MANDLKKIGRNMDLFRSSIKLLGTALAGVFSARAIIEFGKASYQEYQKQYKSEQLLLRALNNRQGVQQRLIRQAQTLRRSTLFDDQEIIDQQKTLASLGYNEGKIMNIMNAAVDLATARNTDLGSAVEALSKTYAGSSRELGRLVPEIKAFSAAQMKAGAAVKWVAENMQGLAEVAANADPVAMAAKGWGEIKESIGKVLAPSIKDAGTIFTKWGEIMTSELLRGYDRFVATIGLVSNHKYINDAFAYISQMEADRDWLDKNAGEAYGPDLKTVKQWEAEQKAIEENAKAVKDNLKARKDLFEYTDLELGNMTRAIQTSSTGLITSKVTSINSGSLESPAAYSGLLQSDTMRQWEDNYKKLLELRTLSIQVGEDLARTLEGIFESVAVSFGQMLGDLLTKGKKFDGSEVLYVVAEMMQRLGELAIAAGITMKAIKETLTSHPVLAIAAGVALVALAQAVRNSADNIVSGGGSGNIGAYEAQQTQLSVRRNLGDNDIVEIRVVGKIDGNDIRLSNERSTAQHNSGY